jgi:hypothetical protein
MLFCYTFGVRKPLVRNGGTNRIKPSIDCLTYGLQFFDLDGRPRKSSYN